MTANETKSQRLFRHAYNEAYVHVTGWPDIHIDALSSLHDGTDECICQRTVNAIRKHAERKQREIDFLERHCNDMSKQREALAIVLKTCDNWERDEKAFKARLTTL